MKTSESIKEIAVALCEFSKEVKSIEKNAKNPFYNSKYADLANILKEVKPLLARYNLSVVQSTRSDSSTSAHNAIADDFLVTVETMIMHSSGQFIVTEVTVPGAKKEKSGVKLDAQTVGSAITYGRRYGLSAALNISTDDEDDGNVLVNGNTRFKNLETNNKVIKPEMALEEIKRNIDATITIQDLEKFKKDLHQNYTYTTDVKLLKDLFKKKEESIKKVFGE